MQRGRIGLGVAALGTILALLAFVPALNQGVFSIPIILGGLLYLGGGLTLAASPPSPEREVMMKRLRVLRIIFALVVTGYMLMLINQL